MRESVGLSATQHFEIKWRFMSHLKDDDFFLRLSNLFIYLFLFLSPHSLRRRRWLSLSVWLSLFMINFRFVLLLLVFCVCSSAVCFYWFVCNFLFRFINHLIVNQLYTIYFLLMLSICVWAGVKTKTKCVYEKPKIGIKKRWLAPDPFPYVCINPFPISFYFSLYFLCLFLLFVVRFYFWIFLLFCKMFVAHTHTHPNTIISILSTASFYVVYVLVVYEVRSRNSISPIWRVVDIVSYRIAYVHKTTCYFVFENRHLSRWWALVSSTLTKISAMTDWTIFNVGKFIS